jgi:hypothetical protein
MLASVRVPKTPSERTAVDLESDARCDCSDWKHAPGETDRKNSFSKVRQHYRVCVAIGRLTGQVIDKQIEVVNEQL